MDTGQKLIDIASVAGRMGITLEAEVAISVRQDDKDRLIEMLQAQVVSQGEELDARRREVQELHQLLAALASRQDGRGSLGPPNGTGRFGSVGHDTDIVLRDQLQAALAPPQTIRWWQFWR